MLVGRFVFPTHLAGATEKCRAGLHADDASVFAVSLEKGRLKRVCRAIARFESTHERLNVWFDFAPSEAAGKRTNDDQFEGELRERTVHGISLAGKNR